MRNPCVLLLLMLIGCSDDPVSHSMPVGINLKAKSSDVSNSVISEEKQITTESGNPYGAFVSEAQQELGADPGRIEIDKVTLILGAQSINVAKLEDVYAGDVDVAFIMNDSNNTHVVGNVLNPVGVGPLELSVAFDSDAVADADFEKMMSGSFKVMIRGSAAAGFSAKGAEADLQVTFTFAAFE
jgi:hypothetical protein